MKLGHSVILLVACGFVAAGAIAMGQLLDLSQSMLLALLANGLWLAAATGVLVSLGAIGILFWRARTR